MGTVLRRYLWLFYLLALGAFFLAVAMIVVAGLPLTRQQLTVDGVPVEAIARRDHLDGPAVVVAHGFAGSRQLMYALGYTLAHHGYAAYLLDFSGHGANPRPLAGGMASSSQDLLQSDLDAVVRYAAARHPAVAILGHSMGGGAVTRYGAEHAGVAATIALSAPSGQVTPELPHNFLLMAGAWEFPSFVDGARSLLRQAGGSEPGALYGSLPQGSARQLVLVPQAEHILILFSPRTLAEAVAWLDGTFGLQAQSGYLDSRMLWVGLAYLAALVLARPLAGRLLAGSPAQGKLPMVSLAGTAAIFAAAAIGAPLLARLLPDTWLPLAVAGYVANYWGLFGLLTLAGAWLLGPARAWPLRRWLNGHGALAALALAAYLFLTMAVLGQHTWGPFVLSAQRLPWLLALLPATLFYFVSGEILIRSQRSPAAAIVAEVTHKGLTLVSLTVAIFLLGAPFFVALLLPVLALLFLAFGLLNHWLYQAGRNPLIGAALTALAVSGTMAAIFPFVG